MRRVTPLVAALLLTGAAAPTAAHAWPFGRKAPAPEPAPATAPAVQPAGPEGLNRLTGGIRPVAPAAAEAPAAPPRPASAEERATALRLDPLPQSAFWAREAELNPKDAEAGVHLAAALRGLGQHREAAEAAERVLLVHAGHVDARLELARAKIAAGQGFHALEPLKAARAARPGDWRIPSLQGVALEQAERLPEARQAWAEALRLSPDNPQVLTNLALSHMAEGNAAEAEGLLRRAAARPDADMRVRQNLALVLGLRGRAAEAEQLLRQDLPPDQVGRNLAWLRARTGPAPRTWSSIQSDR